MTAGIASGRAGTSAMLAVAVSAVLMLVLVTWAASIGPDHVLHRGGVGPPHAVHHARPATSPGTQPPKVHTQRPPRTTAGPPAWLKAIAAVLETVAALVALLAVWRLLRWLLRALQGRPRRGRREQEDVAFDVLEPREELAAALEADADEQRSLLDQGHPRNAIVACWQRFEVAAGRARVVRRPWETPAEFVLHVLDLAGADPAPVLRLADLYREARFSDHPLTEEQRQAAVDALDAVHRPLARRARDRPLADHAAPGGAQ